MYIIAVRVVILWKSVPIWSLDTEFGAEFGEILFPHAQHFVSTQGIICPNFRSVSRAHDGC